MEIIPGCVTAHPRFLDEDEARVLFWKLLTEIGWEQKHMRFGVKEVPLPRLTAWYGDPDANYVYSGIRHVAQPWTASLAAVKPKLDALLPNGLAFNGVLLNYYRNGDDKIGFHADDEKELGETPFIASLSLGGRRRFLLRPKGKDGHGKGTKADEIVIPLDNGTLVVMYGRCQKEWVHAVPPEPQGAEARINLTLRQVI